MNTEIPASIPDLIDRWATIVAFADDIGCGYEAARQMRLRGSIAPEHWDSVISASRAQGIPGITDAWLKAQRKQRKQRIAA